MYSDGKKLIFTLRKGGVSLKEMKDKGDISPIFEVIMCQGARHQLDTTHYHVYELSRPSSLRRYIRYIHGELCVFRRYISWIERRRVLSRLENGIQSIHPLYLVNQCVCCLIDYPLLINDYCSELTERSHLPLISFTAHTHLIHIIQSLFLFPLQIIIGLNVNRRPKRPKDI